MVGTVRMRRVSGQDSTSLLHLAGSEYCRSYIFQGYTLTNARISKPLLNILHRLQRDCIFRLSKETQHYSDRHNFPFLSAWFYFLPLFWLAQDHNNLITPE